MVKKTKNERGAGRKPLPYSVKPMRVPLGLVEEFKTRIASYKTNKEYKDKE